MKELRIPVATENVVDLSEITTDFNGIIIGYKNNKPKGYIAYYDDWYYNIDIEFSSFTNTFASTLLELISKLIKDGYCDSFKVIEFES